VKDRTLDIWHERIDAAAALLADRLDEPPSLDALAAAAGISAFHFHRIWRALTGETVGATVMRLRIEMAKQELARAGSSVTDAAMASGFATSQSFARAFRRHEGMSPSRFRQSASPTRASAGDPVVTIVRRDPVLLVALRRDGEGHDDLEATFGKVWAWAQSAGLADGLAGIYGIPLGDPWSPADRDRSYDACLALGAAAPPPPFRAIMLAGGDYARLRHAGAYTGLAAASQLLGGEWLLHSGRDPADAPMVHHFHDDPDRVPEADRITDILLPLAPQVGNTA